MDNKYPGKCCNCGCDVAAHKGVLEYRPVYVRGRVRGRMKDKAQLWCTPCFNKSDNSGAEDRQCGNRAYEDACAYDCGMGGSNYY